MEIEADERYIKSMLEGPLPTHIMILVTYSLQHNFIDSLSSDDFNWQLDISSTYLEMA